MKSVARLALAVVLTLLCLEAFARLTYEAPWYERLIEDQRPGHAEIHKNGLGLRGPEYREQKPPGTKRVLVLGDSFTFGNGVGDDQAVFSRRLESQLRADGLDVQVLNGGLPGSLTADWVALFDRVQPAFQPDVVLIVFFLRDGTKTAAMTDFFGPIRDEIVARNRASWLYGHSALVRLVRDRFDRLRISGDFSQAIRRGYLGTPEQQQEWRNAQANLRALRERAARSGARIGLVVFPILAGLDESSYPFADVCAVLDGYARREGMPVLDLLPAFRGHSSHDLWVSSANQHPNEEGHRIAAEAIRPFLEDLLRSAPTSGAP